MTHLLDVNVLVALAFPNHVHHPAARAWFASAAHAGWATTPITESGFVRVSANPTISAGKVTVADAIDLLTRLRSVGAHEFWVDDVSIAGDEQFPVVHGYRQITDAHVVALAARRGGSVATFDRAVRDLGDAVTVLAL